MTTKHGIDYFQLETHLDDDMRFLQAKHGPAGYGIVIGLLQKIYQNGYYTEWEEKNKVLFCNDMNTDQETVQEVIETCFENGILSREKFENHGILTSRRIQKEYLNATKRRETVEIRGEYLLVDQANLNENVRLIGQCEHDVNIDPTTNDDDVHIDRTTSGEDVDISEQSRVEKSRVEKSRVDDDTTSQLADGLDDEEAEKEPEEDESDQPVPEDPTPAEFKDYWNEIARNQGVFQKPNGENWLGLIQMTDKRREKLRTRRKNEWFRDNWRQIVRKSLQSKFLTKSSSHGNGERSFFDPNWVLKNDDNPLKILEGNYDDGQDEFDTGGSGVRNEEQLKELERRGLEELGASGQSDAA